MTCKKSLENLPNELLVFILQHVSFKDLARLEQVSRRFGTVVHSVWNSLTNLVLKEDTVFGDFWRSDVERLDDPTFMAGVLSWLLSRVNFNVLEEFDASRLSLSPRFRSDPQWNELCSQAIVRAERPNTNLTSLDLSYLRILALNEMTGLSSLRFVSLRCTNINDDQVANLLSSCPRLERLDLYACHGPSGRGFVTRSDSSDPLLLPNLKFLSITSCKNIKDIYMVPFLSMNGAYLVDGLSASNLCKLNVSHRLYEAIVASLVNTRRLELTCFMASFSQNLHNHVNLVDLDLSGSEANNRAFALVLNRCVRLERLWLNQVDNLNEETFTTMEIKCKIKKFFFKLLVTFLKNNIFVRFFVVEFTQV